MIRQYRIEHEKVIEKIKAKVPKRRYTDRFYNFIIDEESLDPDHYSINRNKTVTKSGSDESIQFIGEESITDKSNYSFAIRVHRYKGGEFMLGLMS